MSPAVSGGEAIPHLLSRALNAVQKLLRAGSRECVVLAEQNKSAGLDPFKLWKSAQRPRQRDRKVAQILFIGFQLNYNIH